LKTRILPVIFLLVVLALFPNLCFAQAATPVTITVWETYAPTWNVNSEIGAFNQSLAAFEAAYPYIKVNVQYHGFSLIENDFISASKVNAAPDAIRIANDWTGVLAPFLAPIDAFGNAKLFSQYYSSALGGYRFGSHTYGLPENANMLALIYNRALVPNPPTTTDQMVKMAQSITTYDSSCNIVTAGIAFNAAGGFGSGYWWWPFLYGFGGSVFSPTNPSHPTVNSLSAVLSVMFADSLVTGQNPGTSCNGVMPPQMDYTTAETMFDNGHAAMLINGPWAISDIQSYGINFGVAPLPTVGLTQRPLSPFVGSQGWAIASGKPVAETAAAWKFIAWMTDYDAQKRLYMLAGDLPSNIALSGDPVVISNPAEEGFLAQEARGTPAINSPNMPIVYSDIGSPLGAAEPMSSKTWVSPFQIFNQLTTAEKTIIKDIG
jgi:arabinogalactan oligomer/maltooligosaccharide transport system substrate-binding protein